VATTVSGIQGSMKEVVFALGEDAASWKGSTKEREMSANVVVTVLPLQNLFL